MVGGCLYCVVSCVLIVGCGLSLVVVCCVGLGYWLVVVCSTSLVVHVLLFVVSMCVGCRLMRFVCCLVWVLCPVRWVVCLLVV